MAGPDGEPAMAMVPLVTALPGLLAGPIGGARLPLGDARLDAALGGGLLLPACHDLHGGGALAFALMLALACPRPGPILWVGDGRGAGGDGQLYADGIAALGGDPGRLILVAAPDATAMLRAGAEVQRCAGVAVLVLAGSGACKALDLTASRRLQLGAAAQGVFTLVLRGGDDAAPPSAAATRWQVQPAPSAWVSGAPGPPRLALHLARQRGGISGLDALLAWDNTRRRLHPALPDAPPTTLAPPGPRHTTATIHPIGRAFAAATARKADHASHSGPASAAVAGGTPPPIAA